jgi:hypothetical protein
VVLYVCSLYSHFVENCPINPKVTNPSFLRWLCQNGSAHHMAVRCTVGRQQGWKLWERPACDVVSGTWTTGPDLDMREPEGCGVELGWGMVAQGLWRRWHKHGAWWHGNGGARRKGEQQRWLWHLDRGAVVIRVIWW